MKHSFVPSEEQMIRANVGRIAREYRADLMRRPTMVRTLGLFQIEEPPRDYSVMPPTISERNRKVRDLIREQLWFAHQSL